MIETPLRPGIAISSIQAIRGSFTLPGLGTGERCPWIGALRCTENPPLLPLKFMFGLNS
jgi:hypothetical protein